MTFLSFVEQFLNMSVPPLPPLTHTLTAATPSHLLSLHSTYPPAFKSHLGLATFFAIDFAYGKPAGSRKLRSLLNNV